MMKSHKGVVCEKKVNDKMDPGVSVSLMHEPLSSSMDMGLVHRGSTGRQKHFLRTSYHQIWPLLTYTEVKYHFTAETEW